MFALLFDKIKGYLAIAGTIVLAVGFAFLKGRSQGKQVATKQITTDINKQAQKVEKKLEKVDNQPVDFDAAVKRLRDRAAKKP
jgi:hypothetical protein